MILLLGAVSAWGALRPQEGERRESPRPEYEVKAGFLRHFILYTQWPEHALPPDAKEFVIGILGDDPFAKHHEKLVGKDLGGRRVVVRRFTKVADVTGVHVLFVGRDVDRETMRAATRAFASKPILLVGEDADFIRSGGMINFVIRDERVRFQVGADAARRAALTISTRLLRLAVP